MTYLFKVPKDLQHIETLSRWPCRCSSKKCLQRVTKRKRPDHYKIEKHSRCGVCGSPLRVDWHRLRQQLGLIDSSKDSGEACYCVGRIYKHRKGQEGCIYRDEMVLERAVNPKKRAARYSPDDPPF